MAAFGTKKQGGELGVQLTFPQVFEAFYNHPSMYYPQETGGALDISVGHDFQANYHEQKRQEANRSVMNGLQARRTQDRLLLTGHQNYHLPKPVLSQRRFANPSLGTTGFSSARQDGSVAAPFSLVQELTGGVLRTAEGQGYIQRKRMERIAQLDRIDALTRGQTVTSAGPQQGRVDTPQEDDTIKFNLLRQALLDDLITGAVNRFTYDNMKDMLKILFELGPIADRTTLEDILAGFDNMLGLIRSLVDAQNQDVERGDVDAIAQDTLLILIEKAREYVVTMVRGMNRQPKDRKTLSKTTIRTLKFDTLLKGDPRVAMRDAVRDGAVDQRAQQQYQDDDGDDEDGDLGRPARAREDDEQAGVDRAPLAGVGFDENRIRFGERSGRYMSDGGGGAVSTRAQFFEPLAEAPAEETAAQMEGEQFDEAAAYQQSIDEVLQESGFREGMDADALLIQVFGEHGESGINPQLEALLQQQVQEKREEFESGQMASTPTTTEDEETGRRVRPTAASTAASRAATTMQAPQAQLPTTREQFDEITSTEEGARALAGALGYSPRAGSSLNTIRTSLLIKLRERGVNLVRSYSSPAKRR